MENKDLALLTVLPKKLDQKHDGLYMKRLWRAYRYRKNEKVAYTLPSTAEAREKPENFVLLLKAMTTGLLGPILYESILPTR